jgi:hypothetical protein
VANPEIQEAWANMSKPLLFQVKSLYRVQKYKAARVGKLGRLPELKGVVDLHLPCIVHGLSTYCWEMGRDAISRVLGSTAGRYLLPPVPWTRRKSVLNIFCQKTRCWVRFPFDLPEIPLTWLHAPRKSWCGYNDQAPIICHSCAENKCLVCFGIQRFTFP